MHESLQGESRRNKRKSPARLAASAATRRRSRGNGRLTTTTNTATTTTRSWRIAVSRSARRRASPQPRAAAALRCTRPALRCRCRHPAGPVRQVWRGKLALVKTRFAVLEEKEREDLLHRFPVQEKMCVRPTRKIQPGPQ
jgi:hypothetical protein